MSLRRVQIQCVLNSPSGFLHCPRRRVIRFNDVHNKRTYMQYIHIAVYMYLCVSAFPAYMCMYICYAEMPHSLTPPHWKTNRRSAAGWNDVFMEMPKDYLSMGKTIVFATCSVSHLSDSDFTLTKVHEGNAKIPTTTEIAWMITVARTQKQKHIQKKTLTCKRFPTVFIPQASSIARVKMLNLRNVWSVGNNTGPIAIRWVGTGTAGARNRLLQMYEIRK